MLDRFFIYYLFAVVNCNPPKWWIITIDSQITGLVEMHVFEYLHLQIPSANNRHHFFVFWSVLCFFCVAYSFGMAEVRFCQPDRESLGEREKRRASELWNNEKQIDCKVYACQHTYYRQNSQLIVDCFDVCIEIITENHFRLVNFSCSSISSTKI